jgi:hypothetical protein
MRKNDIKAPRCKACAKLLSKAVHRVSFKDLKTGKSEHWCAKCWLEYCAKAR